MLVELEVEVHKTGCENSVFEYPLWLTSFSCGSMEVDRGQI
jgi:hypothetical protein